jgi:F-type H+-transporting ATPase subunit b
MSRTARRGILRTVAAAAIAVSLFSPFALRAARANEHASAPHEEAAGGHEHTEGAAEEHDEKGPPPDINWIYGILSEKEGAEPSILFRPAGWPPPFLATVLNFAVLVFLAVRYGKKPLAEALSKRKETILRDIQEASRLRSAAEARLREYEVKLERITEELDQIKAEFREQGERDRDRIVREANERRELMKKDAEFLLSQELKQMRLDLLRETVDEAVRRAHELLLQRLTPADQERFAEQFLAQLRPSKGAGSGSSQYGAVAKGGVS